MGKVNRHRMAEIGRATQFKPGVSPNPAGRPPSVKTLTAWLREELPRPASEVAAIRKLCSRLGLPLDQPIGRVLALALILQALKGCPAAIKELWARVDGAIKEAPPPEVEEIEWDREELILRVKRALEREPLTSGNEEAESCKVV